jgi:hypothetical protein
VSLAFSCCRFASCTSSMQWYVSMTDSRERVFWFYLGRCLTIGLSLPSDEISTAGPLIATGPLCSAPELPAPCCSTSHRDLLEGESLFAFRSRGPVFLIFGSHSGVTSNGELMVTTRNAPYIWKAFIQRGVAWCPEGIIHDTGNYHSSATQPTARYLTPWLRWLVLLRMNPHETPGLKVHIEGRGVS